MRALELTGQTFGLYTVLRMADRSPRGAIRWLCRCACGIERAVVGSDLTRDRGTRSCLSCAKTKPAPGYDGAHMRVRKARGKATCETCVDCPARAAEWSYDGSDPDALTAVRDGYVVQYSVDPARYVPRCISCHRRHDRKKAA